MIKLSASKLKTHSDCSFVYYNKYVKKMPDSVGPGAKRGSVCHPVLERLLNPKRIGYVENILQHKTYTSSPPVKKYVELLAKKEGVFDEENLKLIDQFLVTGLSFDFYCAGAYKVVAEGRFELKTDRYHINGIMDKVAYYDNLIKLFDYKTSKTKFAKADIQFNIQALMYSLMESKRNPGIPIEFDFIFLKYKKAPLQNVSIDMNILSGFEEWLAYMTEYLEDFTFDKALANMASQDITKRNMMCGRELGEFNKAGGDAHVCAFKYPSVYFAAYDGDKLIKTSYKKKELDTLKDKGYTIREEHYEGCPRFKHLWKK